MLGWRSSTGRTGSSGVPGVLSLRLVPGPSPCSSGREHSLEQNWDAWVAKSTSGPAQAGHRNLSCSVKGSDTTSQPTETPPQGSRPGAKGLARPTSIPPTRWFSRLWVTAQLLCPRGAAEGQDGHTTHPVPHTGWAAPPAQAAVRGVLLHCPPAPGHKAALGEDTDGATLLWPLWGRGAMLLTPRGRVVLPALTQGCDPLHTPGTGRSCPTPAHASQDSGWTGGSSARAGRERPPSCPRHRAAARPRRRDGADAAPRPAGPGRGAGLLQSSHQPCPAPNQTSPLPPRSPVPAHQSAPSHCPLGSRPRSPRQRCPWTPH